MTDAAAADTGPPTTYGLISSTGNPRVKAVAALHRARERREQRRYLVEGHKPVREALADGVVDEVWTIADLAGDYAGCGAPVIVVASHVLAKLADTTTPQGVVAVARRQPAHLPDVVGRGVLVVAHEVADPGNAGALVRTADAAGAAGVVVTAGSVDPYGPKAVRAAAGSFTHLPVVVDAAFAEVVDACRAAGQRVIALDARGEVDVFHLPGDDGPVALLLGSEAHGLPDAALARADVTAAIPIHGRAESLNLAAAAAVALYAVTHSFRASSPDCQAQRTKISGNPRSSRV